MTEQLKQGLYYVDDQSNMRPITLREAIDNHTPQKIETLFMKSELLDIYLDLPLPEEWDIISDKDRYDFIQDAIFSNNKPLQGYLRTRVTAKEVMIELFGYPPDKVATGIPDATEINKHMKSKPKWERKQFRAHDSYPTWGFQRKGAKKW